MPRFAPLTTTVLGWTVFVFPIAAQNWVQQGPGPTTGGQVEGMGAQNNPVSGSVNVILAHPTNADILIIGATNGGIWTTTNASGGNPTWTARGQQLPSLSIGSMAFDLNDGTSNTIWAGTARVSSFGEGGRRSGVYRSTDGGATWNTVAGNSTLAGQDIVGLVARGNTIITAARYSDSSFFSTLGIFRSTNGGASFSQVTTGIPQGRNFDLAGDPFNLTRMYTAVTQPPGGTGVGFYRSTDTGASWSLVSPAAMNTHITAAQSGGNVKIAVGSANTVYAGTVIEAGPTGGELSSLWRSGDGGSTWVQLSTLPITDGEGIHPGGQGNLHFSIVVDPTDPNILYVGGDRQHLPSSIGASNFTGRLYRGNVTNPATGAVTWQAITHNPDGNGINVGAPHADSRRMVFDASGRLIETDDGGIYRRVNPTNPDGAWTSLNNNLQVAEIHSSKWDRKTNTLIAGTQDTGTIEQVAPGGATWRTVNQGDGGRVAVDNAGTGVNSFRFTSSQFMGSPRRREYTPANVQVSNVAVPMPSGFSAQFYGPVETNNVVGGRLYVADNRVFESTNATTGTITWTQVGGTIGTVNVVNAGGRLSGVAAPGVLYAGTNAGQVWLRTTDGGALTQLTNYTGGGVRDIAFHPDNWQHVVVADNNQVFRSTNAGTSFTDITGTLPNASTMEIQSTEYVDLPSTTDDVVLIGGRDGVFYARTNAPTVWSELGALTLPNVPIMDLHFVAEDDILMAGTLGRGVFTFANFTSFFSPVPEPSTYACIGLAGGLFFMLRRRK